MIYAKKRKLKIFHLDGSSANFCCFIIGDLSPLLPEPVTFIMYSNSQWDGAPDILGTSLMSLCMLPLLYLVTAVGTIIYNFCNSDSQMNERLFSSPSKLSSLVFLTKNTVGPM